MGLFSCFGLRTRSYNAKKYELSDNNHENKKKNRRSTDFIGVPDTNVYPQLIEETGGEVHSLKDIKDTDDNQCHINNNHKDDNKENKGKDDIEDKVCDDCAEHQKTDDQQKTEDNHKVMDHPNTGSDNSVAEHQSSHSTDLKSEPTEPKSADVSDHTSNEHHQQSADHNVSVVETTSHNISDHNTVPMDTTTSDFSGGVDSSGADCGGGGDCGGGDCGGGD